MASFEHFGNSIGVLEAEFKKIDVNGGGIILFDESAAQRLRFRGSRNMSLPRFCRYFTDRECPEAMQDRNSSGVRNVSIQKKHDPICSLKSAREGLVGVNSAGICRPPLSMTTKPSFMQCTLFSKGPRELSALRAVQILLGPEP